MSVDVLSETDVFPASGQAAPDADLARVQDGQAVSLSSLWERGPAILVFMRHLGCSFCKEHTAQLHADRDRFEQYGATVALISVARPEDTLRFVQKRDLTAPFVCLCDADKIAYRRYGLTRAGAGDFLAPHVLSRGIQATLHGYFSSMPKGDPFQLPGVFIVDTSGTIGYAHRNKDIAANPPNTDLFAVLDCLAAD